MPDPNGLSSSPPAGVITEIAPEDVMYKTAPEHYFWWGNSAMRCLRLALDVAGCGHGHVMRMVRAEWSDAEITACDLDASGVEFCARMFGATAVVPSSPDPAGVQLQGQFDLIWCGSVFTHVDAPRWVDFLDLFESVLAVEGVLVFTTHGDEFVERYAKGRMRVPVPSFPDLSWRYGRDGFGYCDYPSQSGYGISLSSLPWVVETVARSAGLRHLLSASAAWGGLHDVHAYSTP
jgi:hypothetical protein